VPGTIEPADDQHDYAVDSAESDVKSKEDEVLLVVDSDAVVDPWAVVIHLLYARLSSTAVMTTWRLVSLSPRTGHKRLAILLED
jgi:hypothetical protein